jgi:hypothetical protein
MSNREDGGSAFPSENERDDNGQVVSRGSYGMSLRDWFAGQALHVVHAEGGRYGPAGAKQVAEYSYSIADAVLAERAK